MAHFRTRARTVDMLGRQQIAGIPTAISELFKNAHDAYAGDAIVDYFRSDGLFVLRDNGYGMTLGDFEERWLTLGTESRLLQAQSEDNQRPPGEVARPVLGEKGIGRLAIAAIGPQVLVLTRALRNGELGDVIAAFLHWGMFELPGVDLAEVEIPIIEGKGGELPDASFVAEMVGDVRRNLISLEVDGADDLREAIQKDLRTFEDIDPATLSADLEGPQLATGSGTHFFIRPSSHLLPVDLDQGEKETSPLLRTLVGFSNTMTPDHDPPLLKTSFRNHWSDDAYEDVIDETTFFTPDEFQKADQHIHGDFDLYGDFVGEVAVYDQDPVSYEVAWPARGEPTRCGPFRLDLAYVQGNQRDSALDPEAWGELSKKLGRFGGLYIYRDGVRVLPYGNADFDWLEVERRRTVSASDYFFSYRWMFGVVEIDREHNIALREKAGREGFAANEAYRQFRGILMNFMYQVAFDFFRDAGAYSDRFRQQKDELQRLDKARTRRAKQVTARRAALRADLTDFVRRIDSNQPRKETDRMLAELRGRLAGATNLRDPVRIADEILAAESSARSTLGDVVSSYEIRRPRGVGFTKELVRSWSGYEIEHARIDDEIFEPARAALDAEISDAVESTEASVDRRLRFDSAVELAADRGRQLTRTERRELRDAGRDATARSADIGRRGVEAVEASVQNVLAQAARIDVSSIDNEGFTSKRAELEESIRAAVDEQSRAIQSVTEQLRGIVWPQNGAGEFATGLDEVEALETDLEALRDRVEEDLELTQMGLAIEVINHEFHSNVRQVRRNLQRMKQWADINAPIREPYRELRRSFEHLDSYLKLFTPLHRRLHRTRVPIRGKSIEKYLRDLFQERLNDENVELVVTKRFEAHELESFPSTIYPVFVNLVDNALFWLSSFPGKRRIKLDAKKGMMSVEDSGPGVPAQFRDSIFEQGFSEKPGGTGLGLFIARQVLEREGMELRLALANADAGARFEILEERETG